MGKVSGANRNSSVELLRIIAMVFIVMSHYSLIGSVNAGQLPISANKLLLQTTTLGNLGVDIFMMISGYFGVRGKFKPKKMVLLMAQVWFYSAGLYFLTVAFGITEFSVESMIYALFPTVFIRYWFFTAYIVVYFFSPYLNKMLLSLSAKEMKNFITGLLVIWSILPIALSDYMYVDEFIQLGFLYCIGAGLALFPESKCHTNKFAVKLIAVCAPLLPLSVYIFDVIGQTNENFRKSELLLYSKNSILMVGLAAGMLICFANKKPSSSKAVDIIAGCTFGVYLIHENPNVRDWLWKTLLSNEQYAQSPIGLIQHMIVCVATVFAACTAIEFIRKNTVEKGLIFLLDRFKKPSR